MFSLNTSALLNDKFTLVRNFLTNKQATYLYSITESDHLKFFDKFDGLVASLDFGWIGDTLIEFLGKDPD